MWQSIHQMQKRKRLEKVNEIHDQSRIDYKKVPGYY